MNTDKILFSVFPQTTWRVTLFLGENTLDASVIDSVILYGFDSTHNYFPQEVVDYVKQRQSKWFSSYRHASNYLLIQVQRNGKWETIFNWPISRFSSTITLPLSS